MLSHLLRRPSASSSSAAAAAAAAAASPPSSSSGSPPPASPSTRIRDDVLSSLASGVGSLISTITSTVNDVAARSPFGATTAAAARDDARHGRLLPLALALTRRLQQPTDPYGEHVAAFLTRYGDECEEARRALATLVTPPTETAAEVEPIVPGEHGGETAAAAAAEEEDDGAEEEGRERIIRALAASIMAFEASLLEALYANGVAQQVEREATDAAAAAAAGRRTPALAGADGGDGPNGGSDGSGEGGEGGESGGGVGETCGVLAVLDAVEIAFMPQCLKLMRPLHARARAKALAKLGATRRGLRLAHPSVIGLRQGLVVDGEGVPCTTVLEASWLYGDAIDHLSALPHELTVAARLRRLAASLEAFVGATRGRCKDGLSADDLVPLLTLALVTGRSDGFGFEGFLLDEMLPDVVSSGRESYCACTFAVALGFLHAVETPGAS